MLKVEGLMINFYVLALANVSLRRRAEGLMFNVELLVVR